MGNNSKGKSKERDDRPNRVVIELDDKGRVMDTQFDPYDSRYIERLLAEIEPVIIREMPKLAQLRGAVETLVHTAVAKRHTTQASNDLKPKYPLRDVTFTIE